MAGTPKGELKIHSGLFLAELICIPAFVIELLRALSGNRLSWAYVFEWPLLGFYAIYMWHKLLREERGLEPARSTIGDDKEDVRLKEWNAYLESVHRNDSASTSTEDSSQI
jgi:hypothetical protein